jgi:hypothetical protein
MTHAIPTRAIIENLTVWSFRLSARYLCKVSDSLKGAMYRKNITATVTLAMETRRSDPVNAIAYARASTDMTSFNTVTESTICPSSVLRSSYSSSKGWISPREVVDTVIPISTDANNPRSSKSPNPIPTSRGTKNVAKPISATSPACFFIDFGLSSRPASNIISISPMAAKDVINSNPGVDGVKAPVTAPKTMPETISAPSTGTPYFSEGMRK